MTQPSSQSLAAGIDDLVAALKPRRAQQGDAAGEDGAASVSGSPWHQAHSSVSLSMWSCHKSPGLPDHGLYLRYLHRMHSAISPAKVQTQTDHLHTTSMLLLKLGLVMNSKQNDTKRTHSVY